MDLANWSPEVRRDATTLLGPLPSPSTVRPSGSIATTHSPVEETEAGAGGCGGCGGCGWVVSFT